LVGLRRYTEDLSGKTFDEMEQFDKKGVWETTNEQIRRALKPLPGKEAEAERVFQAIERATIRMEREAALVRQFVRGLLVPPSMRRLLALSDAFMPDWIPRWSARLVLRLAHVVNIGVACRELGAASVRLAWGNPALATPVFAASYGQDWCDNVASYVVAGQFGAEIGQFVLANPEVFDGILQFRETQGGVNLRKEVLQALSTSAASDVVVAINGGLRSTLPARVLQEARDGLAQLLINKGNQLPTLPCLWNNTMYSGQVLALWHAESARLLQGHCRKLGITAYDPCPCGSGEKLKFCCLEPLRR